MRFLEQSEIQLGGIRFNKIENGFSFISNGSLVNVQTDKTFHHKTVTWFQETRTLFINNQMFVEYNVILRNPKHQNPFDYYWKKIFKHPSSP